MSPSFSMDDCVFEEVRINDRPIRVYYDLNFNTLKGEDDFPAEQTYCPTCEDHTRTSCEIEIYGVVNPLTSEEYPPESNIYQQAIALAKKATRSGKLVCRDCEIDEIIDMQRISSKE